MQWIHLRIGTKSANAKCRHCCGLLAAGIFVLWTHTASADQGPRWFVRGGPAYANFDASAHVSVAGTPIPAGDVSVASNTGGALEVGYEFDAHWRATLAIGIPPKARIFGSGALAGAGKLGEATYGPTVLGLLFAPEVSGRLKPYLGGGLNYTVIFGTNDGALSGLKVENAFGAVLQFGTEYELSPRTAFFIDYKKVWLKTNAYGGIQSPGGILPASARVELDPIIVNTGLAFHF